MDHKWHLLEGFGRSRPESFTKGARWYWLGLLLAFGLWGCAPRGAPIPEAQFPQGIVGDWQGTVGNMKESVTFSPDGKFVSQLRPLGFISNTLGQGVTGTIRGTWVVKGRIITLNITSAKDERLLNRAASSAIVTFGPHELVVQSARGEMSTFRRVLTL